jgi:cytochrome c-type biogenesis protein CcmH
MSATLDPAGRVLTVSAPGTGRLLPATAPRAARFAAAALALATLLLVLLAAATHAATPRTTLEDVERELMCVTCGTPLNQSDALQANRERAEIERLIAQGKTKDQVIDGMVDVYGEDVLLNPPEDGLRAARWLFPAAGALIGLTILLLVVRRWRRRPDTPDDDSPAPDAEPDLESSSPDLTADDQRRLDADLRRYA